MDFFSSLLKAYERAELEGLVDQHGDKDEPVLLPLFHESKKAFKNIVNVTLNKEGEVLAAEWLDDGTRIIFPVTPASVTRTAKPEPHPLVDKLKTYTPDFPAYTAFHERLEEWTVSTVDKFVNFWTPSPQLLMTRTSLKTWPANFIPIQLLKGWLLRIVKVKPPI